MFRKINWDGLGITASVICAVHCAFLPVLFTTFPLLGIDFLKEKHFEYLMIAIAFVIGAIAMAHGYRKHHHRLLPMLYFSTGFIFLLTKEWYPKMELTFLAAAVILMLLAHLQNFRLSRQHHHPRKTANAGSVSATRPH